MAICMQEYLEAPESLKLTSTSCLVQTKDSTKLIYFFVFGYRNGVKKQDIILPCKQIPSSAWGGKHLDELYVTSSTSEILFGPQPEPAGRLFVVRGLGERGYSGSKACV